MTALLAVLSGSVHLVSGAMTEEGPSDFEIFPSTALNIGSSPLQGGFCRQFGSLCQWGILLRAAPIVPGRRVLG